MGFGWLMVGYFFANIMSIYSQLSFAMLAGYPMMIFGLFRLAPFHSRFRTLFYASFASLPFAVYYSLYGFSLMGFGGGMAILEGSFYTVMEWCYFAFSLVFYFLLLHAIEGLSAELGLIELRSNAWRNMLMMALFYISDCIIRLPFAWDMNVKKYFILVRVLLMLMQVLLNMYLIFKCYRHICPEGEEQPRLPLRKKGKQEKKEDET